MTKQKRSFGDKVKQNPNRSFVGRTEEINLFQKNLAFGPDSDEFLNIFNIFGQSGVGKSTLVERRYVEMAKAAHYCTALIDVGDHRMNEVTTTLNEMAKQLDPLRSHFKKFNEQYKKFLQEKGRLESDPDRPKGTLGALVTEGMKWGGKAGREAIPGSGMIVSDGMIESVAKAGGEWADFVGRKLTNKDEVDLILRPIEVLSPLWREGFEKLAEDKNIAVFIDTYESANPELDKWLVEFLHEKFGSVPLNFILCISGQEGFSPLWNDYREQTIPIPLEPFSVEEAEAYLRGKNITSPVAIEQIIALSNCLPVYLSLLAEGAPDAQDHIADPNEKVVERFLKHIHDSVQKKLAQNAALARKLNKDIVACMLPENTSDEEVTRLFDWLRARPFVKKRGDYWAYHSAVQDQMMRYQKQVSEKDWEAIHLKIAEGYKLRTARWNTSDRETCFNDETWRLLRLEQHFHLLCADLKKHLPDCIRDIATMIRLLPASESVAWWETVESAEKTAKQNKWGQILKKGIGALMAKIDMDGFELAQAINQSAWINDKDDQALFYSWEALCWQPESKDRAIECYQKAIELKPDAHAAYNNMGNVWLAKGDKDQAITCYQKAIEIKPDNHVFFNMGIAWSDKGDKDQAITCYQKAIELKPNFHQVYNNLGIAWSGKGDKDQAISCYQKAIELKPDDSLVYYNMGNAWSDKGNKDQAISYYQKAIELRPDDYEAFFKMGNAWSDKGDKEQAITCYQKTIELKPDSYEAYINMANAWSDKGDKDQAISCYQKAIELKPDHHKAYNNMGNTCSDKGDKEQAITCYQKAIELKPDDYEAYINMANAWSDKGDKEQAISYYQKVIEIKPDKQDAYINIGFLYLQSGDLALADKYISQAIHLGSIDYGNMNMGHVHLGCGNKDQALECYVESLRAFTNKNTFWKGMQDDFQYLTQYGITESEYQEVLAEIKVRVGETTS